MKFIMDSIIKEEPLDAPESPQCNENYSTVYCKLESGIHNEFTDRSEDFCSVSIKSEGEENFSDVSDNVTVTLFYVQICYHNI